MKDKKVLVIGATGLVGQQIIFNLVNDTNVVEIVCLGRRSIRSTHTKLEYHKINFEKLLDYESLFENVTDVICSIGTTIKKAKSKEKFKFVDYEIPKMAAQIAKAKGVNSFSLISSMGANFKSRVFYLQVKGEIEDVLKSFNFQRTLIYRPSLLLGKRLEYRFGEQLGGVFFKLFSWCVSVKYLQTDSAFLAKIIIENLYTQDFGVKVYESYMLR